MSPRALLALAAAILSARVCDGQEGTPATPPTPPAAVAPDPARAEADRQAAEALNRLVVTVLGGGVVTVIGLFVKREVDIYELYNLTKVLKHQVAAVLDRTRPLDDLIPVKVDDFKPLSRYMEADELIAVLQTASLVTLYGSLAQELIKTKPQDAEKRGQMETEMTAIKEFLAGLVRSRPGEFKLQSLRHKTFDLW